MTKENDAERVVAELKKSSPEAAECLYAVACQPEAVDMLLQTRGFLEVSANICHQRFALPHDSK